MILLSLQVLNNVLTEMLFFYLRDNLYEQIATTSWKK